MSSSADAPSTEDKIAMLMAMGYDDVGMSRRALEDCDGDINDAVSVLESSRQQQGQGLIGGSFGLEGRHRGGGADAEEAVTLGCPVSQYNVDCGRSACTCMALTAATNFLERIRRHPDPRSFLRDGDFLRTAVMSGAETYRELARRQQQTSPSSSVEHTSAEEVLASGSFPQIRIEPEIGILQGMLTNDPQHPLGLHQQLSNCRPSSASGGGGGWVCVLITKTPETLLVCLPPPDGDGGDGGGNGPPKNRQYVVIDSHPRPNLFGSDADGAYCRIHVGSSMSGMIRNTLQRIFPVTDLGPDVPEIMASMYNTFDLYPLVPQP